LLRRRRVKRLYFPISCTIRLSLQGGTKPHKIHIVIKDTIVTFFSFLPCRVFRVESSACGALARLVQCLLSREFQSFTRTDRNTFKMLPGNLRLLLSNPQGGHDGSIHSISDLHPDYLSRRFYRRQRATVRTLTRSRSPSRRPIFQWR